MSANAGYCNSTLTMKGVSMMRGSMSMSLLSWCWSCKAMASASMTPETKDITKSKSRIYCSRQNNMLPRLFENGAPRFGSFRKWREEAKIQKIHLQHQSPINDHESPRSETPTDRRRCRPSAAGRAADRQPRVSSNKPWQIIISPYALHISSYPWLISISLP